MTRSLIRRLLVAAAATVALAAMSLPAQADPALSTDTQNGVRTVLVRNPENPAWYVTVVLDNVLGFRATGDSGPEFLSPYTEVRDGPGSLHFQVENQRERVDKDGVPEDIIVNDFFPAKVANPRSNTPLDCVDGAVQVDDPVGGLRDYVTVLPDAVVGTNTASLYDERDPPGTETKNGVCEGEIDEVKNPLHNATDYAPDVLVIRARGDWIDIGVGSDPSGVFIQRAFIRVRWNDNSVTAHTVLSFSARFGDRP